MLIVYPGQANPAEMFGLFEYIKSLGRLKKNFSDGLSLYPPTNQTFQRPQRVCAAFKTSSSLPAVTSPKTA